MLNNIAPARNTRLPLIIAIGILFGIISVLSPGTIFDLILVCVIAFIIYRFPEPRENLFLTKLFISGLALRVVLLIVVQIILIYKGRWFESYGDKAVFLFGDDGWYTARSWWIAQHVSGVKLDLIQFNNAFGAYGYSFYLYIAAFFYYLFGFSPVSSIFLNCIVSVLTGIVYYFITKEISSERSARVAAVVTVFYPSLVIWSIANLKDTVFIFFVGIILLAFARFTIHGKVVDMLLFLAALFALFLIRPHLNLFIFAIIAWASMSYLLIKIRMKVAYLVAAVLIVSLSWPLLYPKFAAERTVLINYQRGAAGKGICYRIYDDWVYHPDANLGSLTNFELLKGTSKGLLHFFMEPFPWKTGSRSSLLTIPYMTAWYLMLLFAVVGVFIPSKYNNKITYALAAFFVCMGSIFALTGGNIGTIFRIRDMFTPLVIVFASIGLRSIFSNRNP